MNEIKALTVLQPWAWAIAHAGKRVENRIWKTNYRGPLAIHAGKSLSWMDREDPAAWPARYGVELPDRRGLVLGAFVAVAELVDCVPLASLPAELIGHPWACGPFCWILDNVRAIEPIKCPGAQQLWTPPQSITPSLLASARLAGPT